MFIKILDKKLIDYANIYRYISLTHILIKMIVVPDELIGRAVYFAQENLPLEKRVQRVSFLAEQMQSIPDDAISKMTYFAGAVGCQNLCQMCATGSAPNIVRITREGIEDLIEALERIARERKIAVASEREFRPGQVLLYFDDDPALNYLTGDIAKNMLQKLGVKIAISTHGWSRKNTELQDMHEALVRDFAVGFGEFRMSYSSYPRGFTNQDEYTHDLANMLRTYKPLIEIIGRGPAGMRVEMHTRPLVQINNNFNIETIAGHFVIHSGSYLVITKETNVELTEAAIINFEGHDSRIPVFDKKGVSCTLYVSDTHLNQSNWRETAQELIPHQENIRGHSFAPHYNNQVLARKALLYQYSNADGTFFSLDPTLDNPNQYFNALNLYPKTESRFKSGALDTSRFILNAILQYKQGRCIGVREPFPDATLADMQGIVAIVEQYRDMYSGHSADTAKFIDYEILPLIRGFINALTEADYPPSFLFDWQFFSDIGTISNAGRAINEFRGLSSKPDYSIELNDEKIRLLNEKKGSLWRWAPVPYAGNLDGRPIAVQGLKNQLGNISGIVEVCQVTRRNYEPMHEPANYIFGVPMEQISFNDMKNSRSGPGSR